MNQFINLSYKKHLSYLLYVIKFFHIKASFLILKFSTILYSQNLINRYKKQYIYNFLYRIFASTSIGSDFSLTSFNTFDALLTISKSVAPLNKKQAPITLDTSSGAAKGFLNTNAPSNIVIIAIIREPHHFSYPLRFICIAVSASRRPASKRITATTIERNFTILPGLARI